jgi:hypothetical protein
MTVYEITDLPRFMIWVDGFMPDYATLHGVVSSSAREAMHSRLTTRDDAYLKSLEGLMRSKRALPGQAKRPIPNGEVYLVTPLSNPGFPSGYDPVHRELNCLRSRQEDYRLHCFILIDGEPVHARDSLLHAVQQLKFEIRHDSSYDDLMGFRDFLYELSYHKIVAAYFAPSLRVEKDLVAMGFATESVTIP